MNRKSIILHRLTQVTST